MLQIKDKDDNTCLSVLKPLCENSENRALEKNRRKIYIISSSQEVLYIGEAVTSMQTRFKRGCTSYNYFIKNKKARNGYRGYKWLNNKENLERKLIVNVAIFESEYNAAEKRNIIEAIEAELVHLTRSQLGYWPKFQNEIHFQNDEDAKETAAAIFKEISLGKGSII